MRWLLSFVGPRLWRTVILLLYVLNVGYFIAHIPAFESLDEINHVMVAHFIASEGRLPTMADAPPLPHWMIARVQYNQPPLPYLVGALALHSSGFNAPFDAADASWRLPPAEPEPLCRGEPYRVYLWTAADRVYVAVHVLRMVNVGFGLLTLALLMRATRGLFRSEVAALFAGALFACSPPIAELHAWYNNDVPVMLCGALALWGFSLARQSWWQAVGVLFVAAVLAALTKLTGFVLVLVVAVYFWWHWVQGHFRRFVLFVTLMGSAGSAWLVFNYARCGLPLCRLHHGLPFSNAAELLTSLLTPDYIGSLAHFLQTSALPWISPAYPPSVVLIALGLLPIGVGLCAAVYATQRGRDLWPLWLLLLAAIGLALLRVYWSPDVTYMAFRYIAVAVPALLALVALGWLCLVRCIGHWVLLLPPALLLALTASVPLLYYQPVYDALPMLQQEPASITPFQAQTYANGVQVVGYSVNTASLQLYWRSNQAQDTPLYAIVVLYDANRRPLEQCGITLGTALNPVTMWPPETLIQQHFWFNAPTTAAWFSVQIFDIVPQYYLYSYTNFSEPYPILLPDETTTTDLIYWPLQSR
jgi:hypothetical protein